MKTKDFLRSDSFKCIVVLLVIALVCGVLLAVANDLFYVSDEELWLRSMEKVYDGDTSELESLDISSDRTEYTALGSTAVVEEACSAPDGIYLVKSRADRCGYSDGSLTLWVNLSTAGGAPSHINGIVVESYDSSQTLIGSIDADYLAMYSTAEADATVAGGGWFTNSRMESGEGPLTEVVASGATYTSRAVNAAVNGALGFVRDLLAGEGV